MMRTFAKVFAVAINLVLFDAISKEIAAAALRESSGIAIIPGFFNLAYVENRGCAWGLFQGMVWPLAVFGCLAFAFFIWKRKALFYAFPVKRRGFKALGFTAECLLYAGIAGNLIDRIFRGYVIDFLDFHWGASHFPCFNLADSYISIAAFILIAMSFIGNKNAA